MISDREIKEREEVVEMLKTQLQTEGKLIGLYEEHERKTGNKAIKRLMQMYRLDSQKHINIIQAAIEVIQGEEVFIEDRKPLAETLKQHLELEKEALDNANKILNKIWVEENKGLKGLLELWREDERRHHKGLKEITSRPYIRLNSNDMVTLFRGEEFLEERYRRAKEFKAKQDE